MTMLATRLIPVMLYKDFGLVKGVKFDSWRRVGTPMQSVRLYNMREVDELIFLDISATNTGTSPDFFLIKEMADECFMPLTVGGGIRDLEDIKEILRIGADKVCLNTMAVRNPELIKKASEKFGSQAIVVSIDVDIGTVHTNSGTRDTGLDPVDWAVEVEKLGAGEILINSVEHDGTMAGYDLELIESVSTSVSIPVIACGGAGSSSHMIEAIERGASAVAASSLFHFTEKTPLDIKREMSQAGLTMRLP